MIEISENENVITFEVRVVPRASRSEIVGEIGGAVKVRVASPPVDGAANAELVKFLAKTMRVPRSNVEIVSGQTSRTKLIRITGATAEQVRTALG